MDAWVDGTCIDDVSYICGEIKAELNFGMNGCTGCAGVIGSIQ